MNAESRTTAAAEHRFDPIGAAAAGVAAADPVSAGLVTQARRLARRFEHLVKYLLIGAMASAIDLGLFLILHNAAGLAPLAAHSVSVPAAVVFSFTCNAVHNFRTTDLIPLRFASFITVAFIGYLVGVTVIATAHEGLGLDANAAKVLSLPLVFVVQYLLNSRLSFRKAAGARRRR